MRLDLSCFALLVLVVTVTGCDVEHVPPANRAAESEAPVETTKDDEDKTDQGLSDQRMAASPEELIAALESVSFLRPTEYEAVRSRELDGIMAPLELGTLPQRVAAADEQYSGIVASDIQEYLNALTEISIQSKNDGNLIWGRIQGTKYERQASEWAEQKLMEFGFTDVRKDRIPARRPLWHLEELEFAVTQAPTFDPQETYTFASALTAYQSATTPPSGIEAPVVFVGEGTPAELQGRDLEGKLVLLRSRGLPGGLFHSARTAYSRIVVGEYGNAAGVIVWSDVPNASQVAARVGSIGGGNNLGLALPWTVINNNDGYYLRKLLDKATPENPVVARLNVQGEEQGPDKRYSYNVYGVLPGQTDEYIMLLSHIDGFLYGVHCNAGAVSMNLAVAKHYAQLPLEQRTHGLIVLFVGDHENPGVGATDKWLETNPDLAEKLLVNLRPEKVGMIQEVDEGWVSGVHSNMGFPGMLMVTNKSPLLLDLFRQAANRYSIASSDFYFPDPAADETNFHPPYVDMGIISAVWTVGSRYYHTTADYERDLVSAREIEKLARGHAFIIDALSNYTKSDLEEGAEPYTAEQSIYQSDALKLMLGNH